MKYILTFFLLIIANSGIAQAPFVESTIRKSLLDSTEKFPIYNKNVVNFYNPNLFNGVFELATEDELYMLTNHPKPLVRESAFITLMDRNSSRISSLLNKNINDTSEWFSTQIGCIRSARTFVDELLSYLTASSGLVKYLKISSGQKELIRILTNRRIHLVEIFLSRSDIEFE